MKTNLQAAVVTVLLAVHFLLGYGAIKAISPTYDEAVHITAGYSYLSVNDYRMNTQDHPPLAKMWAAVPLLFMKPALPVQHPYWQDIRNAQYPFSELFLYYNKIDAEKMLDSGRMMMTGFSLLLGLMIYFWAREVSGPPAGAFALALWCFMPAFIANTTLVTTDMALTLFFFTSIYFFMKISKAAERPGGDIKMTALFGVSVGLCLASKYSAVGILPIIFVIWALNALKNRKTGKKLLFGLIAGFSVAVLVLWAVYRFNPLGEFYFFGLGKILGTINAGRSSFLLGQYSTSGWLYYFPVTFMLKTPLPFIGMLAAALLMKRTWSRDNVVYLMVPAAIFFAASCFSKMQIGHRHILPVYPFLIVLVSQMISYPVARLWKYVMVSALALFIGLSVKAHPWYISYVNELAGCQDDGYKYLTDSNVDWGQGLKELGKYLKEQKAGGIYLSYFGVAHPSYYGIRYFPVGCTSGLQKLGENIDFSGQEKVFFAISATNLQATYFSDKNVFSFLKKVKPLKIVAHSILVYDLKGDPGTYRTFMELLGRK